MFKAKRPIKIKFIFNKRISGAILENVIMAVCLKMILLLSPESVEENTLDRSPSLESGICSSIRHMTSCRMPPTFRVTLLFIFRDFDIRKGSGSCFSSYYNRSSKTLYYICCIKYLFGS